MQYQCGQNRIAWFYHRSSPFPRLSSLETGTRQFDKSNFHVLDSHRNTLFCIYTLEVLKLVSSLHLLNSSLSSVITSSSSSSSSSLIHNRPTLTYHMQDPISQSINQLTCPTLTKLACLHVARMHVRIDRQTRCSISQLCTRHVDQLITFRPFHPFIQRSVQS